MPNHFDEAEHFKLMAGSEVLNIEPETWLSGLNAAVARLFQPLSGGLQVYGRYWCYLLLAVLVVLVVLRLTQLVLLVGT
jgi:hypothetical protein